MKNKKLFLDFEQDEALSIGLIRTKKKVPYHELFFKINQLNTFNFSRKRDLSVRILSGNYKFPVFGAFDEITQTTLNVIANKSCKFEINQEETQGLFGLMEGEKYFINSDIDFILFPKEDFSIITLPENWVYPVEMHSLYSDEELYQIIINYDE